jgi:hypothetical protein
MINETVLTGNSVIPAANSFYPSAVGQNLVSENAVSLNHQALSHTIQTSVDEPSYTSSRSYGV